jgi:hypothetical protein
MDSLRGGCDVRSEGRARAKSHFLIGMTLYVALNACSSPPLLPFTKDTPPLMLVSVQQAGVTDDRGRFREIYCAVLEARAQQLPDYRPCEKALTRVGTEPAPTGKPVDLGPSRRHLIVGLVPGLGWECFSSWLNVTGSVTSYLAQFGYDARLIEVGGLDGTEENARRIRDAVLAMPVTAGERRVVLIGYSKGAPDLLEAIVRYPEIRPHLAAVVSAAGAVGGSPLANNAKESQADLLQHFPGAQCKSDEKAVTSLRTDVRQNWLAQHPLPRDVSYYSLVTYPDPDHISRMLHGSYEKLGKVDARNDSQLIFYDEVIPGSTLVGYVNADHWSLAVPIDRSHPWITSMLVTENAYPREALLEALLRFVEEHLENAGS